MKRPMYPFQFSDPHYWEAAQRVDVGAVIAALDAQGWDHWKIDDGERFQRVDEEGALEDFTLPLVKDERFEWRVLQAAFLLSVFEVCPIDDILEEWGAPLDRSDGSVGLFDRRKKRRAVETA